VLNWRTRSNWLPLVVALVVAAAMRASVLHVVTVDQTNFLIPWLNAATASGWGYLRASFTNYPPFYEHALALIALFPGPAMVKIKLLSILFDVLLAALVALIAPPGQKALAFRLTVLLPTVALNSAMLGQSDAIYTCGVVLALAAAIADRPVWTMLAFSLAFAVKLQAAMLLPFLVLLALERRQPLWTFVLIPTAYLAFAAPMLLAGRPFGDAMFVYARQFDYFNELSLNAPNLWVIAEKFISYEHGLLLGLPMAAGVIGAMVLALWWSGITRTREGLLLAAAILLITVPYFTPKMHDRYFFLIDPVLVALYCTHRRYLTPLLLAEIASLLSYVVFPIGLSDWGRSSALFGTHGYFRAHFALGWNVFPMVGALLMGLALALLVRRAAQLRNQGDDRVAMSTLIVGRLQRREPARLASARTLQRR
jgi:Gpi18-like mannosyltransferase